ncbi:FtsB family cell division protein [Alteraurantiacibacter palmitatis]|uniref:Septum formation initiator family protein n=1 Tax=Alteraurantiacibacter palmitatis TaxID=2054628 RepID=A0ABV7E3G7_9SPHN
MNAMSARREKLFQYLALGWLLALGALALVGPFGLLSWSELSAKLDARKQQIAVLEEERAVLDNRNRLLDPNNVDPDLGSELVRRNLNVVHPDEYVIELEMQP